MQPDGRVRVGVALDAGAVRRWHSTAVSEIERLGFCEVTVFAREAGTGSTARRLRGAARHWLYEAYALADRRWFGRDDDALAQVPIARCGGDSTRRVHLRGDW